MSFSTTVTSRIVESVKASLLEDNAFSTVIVQDSQGGDKTGNETATKIDSPFNFDADRFLPNTQIMDLPRFVEVAYELISDAQDREGTVSSQQVTLVEDYPAEEFSRFGNEVIAWKLISRKPANMNGQGNGRPQRGHMPYYKIRSAKYPNKWLEIESRPIDHIVEFQCWSKSARLANSRALWLERLFVNHSWAFTVQGADRFYFHSRGIDWYTMTGGQSLYVRPVQFFIRSYEFRIKANSVIKNIQFDVGTTVPETK